MLQSFDRGNLVLDAFTSDFRVELDQRTEQAGELRSGRRGRRKGPWARLNKRSSTSSRSTFAVGPKPDLIVAVAGPASAFARKYRKLLFPDTPLLLAAVDQRYLSGAPLGENETAVAVVNDFPRVLDDMLQVLPQTRQVFMVTGVRAARRVSGGAQLEDAVRAIPGSPDICLVRRSIPLGELLRRAASLPDNSAIFYLTFGTDATGAAYADERVLADLHATANAPLFGAHSVYLGTGIVGGSLMPIDDLSRRTADVAVRLLNGAAPNASACRCSSRSADFRLARAASGGASPRAGCRRGASCAIALRACGSASQGHGADRRRRACRPVAPHRRAPLPASRAAACRERQPAEPGARR